MDHLCIIVMKNKYFSLWIFILFPFTFISLLAPNNPFLFTRFIEIIVKDVNRNVWYRTNIIIGTVSALCSLIMFCITTIYVSDHLLDTFNNSSL